MLESRSPLEKAPPLYERVYNALKVALLQGELQAGERLTETGVAKWLQVSRTPVREAFRQLQREGLIEIDDGGRITVPYPDEQDIRDLFECRYALEVLAARKAARRANDKLVTQLERALSDSQRSMERGQLEQALEHSARFHHALVEAADNRRLLELYQTVWDRLLLIRAAVMRDFSFSTELTAEHNAIVAGLASADPEAIIEALKAHLNHDTERYLRRLHESEA